MALALYWQFRRQELPVESIAFDLSCYRSGEKTMNLLSFNLVILGVLLNAAAQLLLKAGTNSVGHFEFSQENILPVGWQLASEPHILGGLVSYVVSAVVWIMALSRVEVSIAYPMLSIGYVVNAVAAWWLFGEAVTTMRLAGMGIILIGVYIVARS